MACGARAGRVLISIVQPRQVKSAALHSKPKRYGLPSASSKPKISAWPFTSCALGEWWCVVGSGGADLDRHGLLWIELKAVLGLWREVPAFGLCIGLRDA